MSDTGAWGVELDDDLTGIDWEADAPGEDDDPWSDLAVDERGRDGHRCCHDDPFPHCCPHTRQPLLRRLIARRT